MEGSVKKRKVDPPKVGRVKTRKTGRVKTRKTTVEERDYVANLLRVPDVFEMSTPDYVNAQTDVPSQVDLPNAQTGVPSISDLMRHMTTPGRTCRHGTMIVL
jgi:hypothetical protein